MREMSPAIGLEILQWTEEKITKNGLNTTAFTVCDTEVEGVSNWLLLPRLDVEGIKELHVELELELNLDKCNVARRSVGRFCKEMVEIYAAQLEQGEDLQEDWRADNRWYCFFEFLPNGLK